MKRGSSGLNLLLGVNKPRGMSSHDVVNVVRRAIGERRVGHAGTLDPAADGVLVVGVGQGTRLMGMLTADSKSYVATIRFGYETDTDDAEGERTVGAPISDGLRDPIRAQELLDSFLGEQDQVPPAYSAISVGGKRSYARARAGETVVLPARRVRIVAAQLLSIEDEQNGDENSLCWQCAFTVSKGTYVRSIARDLGRRAGSAAHLARLCRTASGTVTLARCVTLSQIQDAGPTGIGNLSLDPVKALGVPSRKIEGREVADMACGRAIEANGIARGQQVAMVRDGRLWGVWESDGIRILAKANFPDGIEGVRP